MQCWSSGSNYMCCVRSTQQQTPHEKAPQPLTDKNRVWRGNGAGAVSGARPDLGRCPAGWAAHHHVLHWQDHQVSAHRSCFLWGLMVWFGLFVYVFSAITQIKTLFIFWLTTVVCFFLNQVRLNWKSVCFPDEILFHVSLYRFEVLTI